MVVEEFLATEAWFDGHDQNHVELVENVEDRLHRLGRTYGEAGLASHIAQLARQTYRGMGGTHVEADGGGTKLGVFRCPAVRILNHQMHVDRQVGDLADTCHDWLTQSQVRDEMMIHHVDMNKIRLGDGLEVTLKVAEIGGQNAWCDLNSHGSHSMEGKRLDAIGYGAGHRHLRRWRLHCLIVHPSFVRRSH